MSIYATLWRLKFPRYGDDHTGCDWIEVLAQGIPAHIGSPTPGFGDEAGDPYAAFLPPAVPVPANDDGLALRGVVIVSAGTPKGTPRSSQEYINPLLVVSGEDYAALPFQDLYERICEALGAGRPRCVAEWWDPAGTVRLLFEDGSSQNIHPG